jgi:hypothetical protein
MEILDIVILNIMKTVIKNMQKDYVFEKSIYNPALDHLQGEVLFKEKIE